MKTVNIEVTITLQEIMGTPGSPGKLDGQVNAKLLNPDIAATILKAYPQLSLLFVQAAANSIAEEFKKALVADKESPILFVPERLGD
jgi:hypothetical protein